MLGDLLHANDNSVTSFSLQDLPAPAKELWLITCVDRGLAPAAIFGLAPSDAKIPRNAVGRVAPEVALAGTWHHFWLLARSCG